MKKTLKEKILEKLIQITKKHRTFKYPAMVLAAIVLFVCGIFDHFRNNVLRYGSLVMVALFFTICSSFTFQTAKIQTADAAVYEAAMAESAMLESMPVLDDSDVLDGYENAELESMENVDIFSVDEILRENNI